MGRIWRPGDRFSKALYFTRERQRNTYKEWDTLVGSANNFTSLSPLTYLYITDSHNQGSHTAQQFHNIFNEQIKIKEQVFLQSISMAYHKTAVTPLLMQWNYCSLALSHWYESLYFRVRDE